jgi:NAD(P)H-dependent flavin oxidoreductase YrpB (nitropropane dioxygenase family)
MATKEAPIHASIKEELVKGTERDTALIMRTFKNTARIFKAINSYIAANCGRIRSLSR